MAFNLLGDSHVFSRLGWKRAISFSSTSTSTSPLSPRIPCGYFQGLIRPNTNIRIVAQRLHIHQFSTTDRRYQTQLWARSSVSQSVPPAPTEPTYQAPSNGVLALLPEKAVPYAELMRLEKPTGLYLFYFPYLFGITFAACNVEPTVAPVTVFSTSLLLFVGTIIMRGAACTWNDTHDRNFDRQVARTRFRPIARGAVTPLQAHAFTLAQAAVGIATLASMPANVSLYAAPNVALLGFYPFAKRITNYPQVILGFPVAWGIFMGSAALGFDPIVTWIAEGNLHGIGAAFGCLYASNLVWTIIYDTIYAHQDVEDDKKAGVKSIAVKHKTNTKPLLSALSVVQMSTLVAAGVLSGMGPVYYVVSCGGASASLAAMVWNVELGSPKSCMWWFKNGALLVGGTITLGLFGEYLSSVQSREESDGAHGREKI